MHRFDLSPLYRTTVGFDHLADLLDKAFTQDGVANGYPPFDIEKTSDDTYVISVAAAGFSESDLNVEVRERQLIVSAVKPEAEDDGKYLHRGIARRSFERRFRLADHMQVTGARFENGMLSVELAREIPEALKPRRIQIATSSKPVIDQKEKQVKIAA